MRWRTCWACAPWSSRQRRYRNARNTGKTIFLHCFPTNELCERFDFYLLCDYTYRYFRSDPENSNANRSIHPREPRTLLRARRRMKARRPAGDQDGNRPIQRNKARGFLKLANTGGTAVALTIVPKLSELWDVLYFGNDRLKVAIRLRGVFYLLRQLYHKYDRRKQEENPYDHYISRREQTRICRRANGA